MTRLPETPAEWQEAVDLAEAWLHVHAAKQYGLITGGPTVDVVRCDEIIAMGKARGITPAPDAVDRLVCALKSTTKE